MERAGAIVVGKTNSPTRGFRGTTDNYLFGPTRNPWDRSRNAGGSSGGAAAAVAAGMLTLAEATDGGGSARIPAAWCGVYGYKQSWGRVPAVLRPNAFGGRHRRRPPGGHADHGPQRCRRRPDRGRRGLRAPASPGLPELTQRQRSVSGSGRIRSSRAGAPATTALSGTSLVTTVDVPTIALSPTVAPRRMHAP
jgi:hypothetical protein